MNHLGVRQLRVTVLPEQRDWDRFGVLCRCRPVVPGAGVVPGGAGIGPPAGRPAEMTS